MTSVLERMAASEESYRVASAMYVEYIQRLAQTDANSQADVAHLYAQAMGYVWGRQDQGLPARHTNDDWRFSAAYGLHALDYTQGRSSVRMAIRNAFEEWMRAGTINGKEG